jgi:hypothetical protein
VEIARLVLEYLKALAWPLVALAIAMLFRHEVRALLVRMKKAALPGGVSLDFAEEIQEAKLLSEKVEASAKEKRPSIPLSEANARMLQLGLRPSPSGLDISYYRDLANQDPNLALAGLRIEFDVLLRNLAQGFKIEVSPGVAGNRLARALHEDGDLTDEQMELLQKVLRLTGAAAHGKPVSREEALKVINIAEVLADQYLSWLSWGFPDGWTPSNEERKPHNLAAPADQKASLPGR